MTAREELLSSRSSTAKQAISCASLAIVAACLLSAGLQSCSTVERLLIPAFGSPPQDLELLERVPPRISLPSVVPQRAEHNLGLDVHLQAAIRVDDAQANSQNWEPSILLVPGSTRAAQDEVDVLWTQGQGTATSKTATRLMLARSTNGAVNFSTSQYLPPAGALGIPFDAMSAVDPQTGISFVGAMSATTTGDQQRSVWVASRWPNQPNFSVGNVVMTTPFVDKGWMAAGPRPTNLGGSALYLAYSEGLQTSLDGGLTFSPPTPIDSSPGDWEVGYQPRVWPDGLLTVTYYAENSATGSTDARIVLSDDGGISSSSPITVAHLHANISGLGAAVPGDFRVAPFVIHTRDPISGTLYVAYGDVTGASTAGPNADILLVTSTDGGHTFSTPMIISSDTTPVASAQFHPWLDIDSKGRLHLLYLDTRRFQMLDSGSNAQIDVYYGTSNDGGFSWQEQRLTNSALQSGNTNWNPFGPGQIQFIGDYLGMAVSPYAVYLAYPADDHGQVAMFVTRVDIDETIFADGFD